MIHNPTILKNTYPTLYGILLHFGELHESGLLPMPVVMSAVHHVHAVRTLLARHGRSAHDPQLARPRRAEHALPHLRGALLVLARPVARVEVLVATSLGFLTAVAHRE